MAQINSDLVERWLPEEDRQEVFERFYSAALAALECYDQRCRPNFPFGSLPSDN